LLDTLQSLTSSKSSPAKPTGFGQKSAEPFDIFGGTATSGKSAAASGLEGPPQISPATMSALLAAQGQSSTGAAHSASTSKSDALKDLFSQLDADGDGQVTKTEFENALGAGGTNIANADRVHSKLDADGDGAVSLDEMLSALTGAGKGHRPPHPAAASDGSDGSSSNPLPKTLQGATTTSVTNSDGTVTTSLTYADGSKVTMTSAAAASSAATSSYNFIEKLIQRQAQAISSASTASLSVSV
jgi:hypothetical protein